MNDATWTQVMALGKKDNRHRGLANTLDADDITTIIATMEFFGADDNDMKQTYYDLKVPRFRVFDWLAMGVMGRIESKMAAKVLVHSFIKSGGDVTAFIADLRSSDYDIDHSWEGVEV